MTQFANKPVYYLCSVASSAMANYDIAMRERVWGVREDQESRIAPVHEGDLLVFSVNRSFRSIHRIESAPFTDYTPVWPTGPNDTVYPLRIRISAPLQDGLVPIEDVYTEISFMRDTQRWSGTLQGRNGVFNNRLTDADMAVIRQHMNPPAAHPPSNPIKETEQTKQLFELCEQILTFYPERSEAFSAKAELYQLIRTLGQVSQTVAELLVPSPHWLGEGSCGRGNWADTPWIGIYDTRITQQASQGVYPVAHFLFASDQGVSEPGIRLGLGVSTTAFTGADRTAQTQQVANQLRALFPANDWAPFWVVGDPDEDRPTQQPVNTGSLCAQYYAGMVLEQFFSITDLQWARLDFLMGCRRLLYWYHTWAAQPQPPAPSTTNLNAAEEPIEDRFLAVLRQYKDEGVIYKSVPQGKWYTVADVDSTGATIGRLSADKDQRVTASSYRTHVERVRVASQHTFDATFHGTSAVRTTFLQGPDLLLDTDKKTLVAPDDDEAVVATLCACITQLHVDHSRGRPRPYIPVLLSCVLEGIGQGWIQDNRITFDDVVSSFMQRCTSGLGIEASAQQAAYAFYHLASEPFWLLALTNPNAVDTLSAHVSPTSLRQHVRHARLKAPFWDLLQNDDYRSQVEAALRSAWLEPAPEPVFLPPPPTVNRILYGPPGTGKTHRSMAEAVGICDESVPDPRTVNERYDQLQQFGRIEFITFHQSYGYEEFIEGIAPVLGQSGDTPTAHTVQYECRPGLLKRLAQRAHADPTHNYVLIIDEINRGNISNILGELITLLEPDRRLGGGNPLWVRLPYSGEEFALPGNVYLLGTMNTADRSIAFMDKALRRRFQFQELMPQYDVLRAHVGDEGVLKGVDVAALLTIFNERIELLADREHQIGHAYFLKVSSLIGLRQVLLKQLLPLLQEYFYDDWSKICAVLGCPFDPDSGSLLQPHTTPLVQTELLSPEAVLGADWGEIEPRVRCCVHPGFIAADEEELVPYFQAAMGSLSDEAL